MLINRDHRGWAAGAIAATAVLSFSYWRYSSASLYGPSGSSWEGLAYGIAGTILMVLAGALSVRKRYRTRRIGSARNWMNLHVWGGLLSVPLILFHSGFALGGPLTTVMMLLFALIVASGIVGVVLQQFVPRIMMESLPTETVRTQIAQVRGALAADAYDIVAAVTGALPEAAEEQEWLQKEKKAGWKAPPRHEPAASAGDAAAPLRALYLGSVRPYLHRRPGQRVPLPDFAAATLETPAAHAAAVDQLRAICEESRRLDVQERLHSLLHDWLYVHAPLSVALFVLVVFHIWYALRY